MPPLQLASLLIVLAALFGTINYFVLRLPQAIGILLVALIVSLAAMALDALVPGLGIGTGLRDLVLGIDFSDALLEGMLGLLLFAGALHVKVEDLRAQALSVFVMATIGVALSVAVVGVGFSWLTGMPLLVALVFGAVVSPTDPVAVLGVLRAAKLSRSLETTIAGESLFNDGVAYVVFLILIGLAFPAAHATHGAAGDGNAVIAAAMLFLREAVGGALLGGVLGWLTFRVMRRIDDYALEVLITLALAFGGYELAVAAGVSAPIMAVGGGLMIGHVGMKYGMSDETRKYVDAFWKMIDEILNAVLFLLIGIEVFAVAFDLDGIETLVAAVALSLAARLVSVAVPVLLIGRRQGFERGTIPIMTWGGLKGGISVALALSLPDSDWKPLILTATYVIVVFSILVQGLSVGALARRFSREPKLV
ncbi:cation:proton antiporter [Rhodovulum visakhapatnamense]|uniref:Cation:proton antiporter n=1 Tax=Rhodovulum visakhapatnamense TaxID=364297 RepID=A0ABS1RFW7_9RHOB|nr:cation:proton antiporter [Rhodovulum visakhapatnamense]MBL3578145.1 cation:proton antiporter [Rhodovulum visakhapatnamense]